MMWLLGAVDQQPSEYITLETYDFKEGSKSTYYTLQNKNRKIM